MKSIWRIFGVLFVIGIFSLVFTSDLCAQLKEFEIKKTKQNIQETKDHLKSMEEILLKLKKTN